VKIYLDQDDVERIGMAVFLNRGQKKLAGGELVEKIAKALKEALEEELAKATKDSPASEATAVMRVMKTQNTEDMTLIVLSQHVAEIMDDDESPWFPVIGRWQGEVLETESVVRKKPLTASNFLAFVSELVNRNPLPVANERQRVRETANLNRLGEVFSTAFAWPDDIPTRGSSYTATAVLCRSFLIRAVGGVLNQRHAQPKALLLSQTRIEDEIWDGLTKDVRTLHKEFARQASLRKEFEDLKGHLTPTEPPPGPERQEALATIDAMRGELWTLDTVIPVLRNRIYDVMGEKK
jgi:hypothetical protein